MAEITLEKTHALLERLAEYVMTQVATRQEMNDRFAQVDERFAQIDKKFEQIDKRFEQIDKKFEQIDERFEQSDKSIQGIRTQLDLIRTEQQIFVKTFDLHHKRLVLLEDESSYRVRERRGKA
ncbi:hypothetical protein JXA02_10130 [candidate division KSB1 bacterium]|nr:hypothetical protein [candidate division KSB1 bacterium]RQW03711.1 MAG: hypothetical protein EH222_12150 [candidate division KSB1 bacterium]